MVLSWDALFSPVSPEPGQNQTKEEYLQASLLALTHFWFGVILLLGTFLFLFLGIMDYYVTPQNFHRFFTYRLLISATLLSLFALNLYLKRKKARLRVVRLGVLAAAITSAITIEAMIMALGGDTSAYYAGMNLLGICIIGFIPLPLRLSVAYVAAIYLTYLGPILLFDEITSYPMFIENNFFLLSTFIITVVWRSFSQENIIRNFKLQFELAMDKQQIERHSHDLEGLVEERTRQKQSTERMLTALFEHANDGILILNREGSIIKANRKAAQIYGFRRDALVGANISLFETRDSNGYQDRRERILAGESMIYEVVHRARNGAHIELEVSATAIDVDGERLIQAFHRDITEKKVLQKQLLQSQKMDSVGQLAGGIAHDFNNILTAILGITELLLSKPDLSEYMTNKVKMIDSAGRRGARMIKQLLGFARKDVSEKVPFNLNAAIKDICDLARSVLPKNIEIVKQFREPIPVIEGDIGQLEQVIMNLIVNARDVMPKGGELRIRTDTVALGMHDVDVGTDIKPGKYVLVAITDTGNGIPEDMLPHIFEPFFTTKERGKGTGLGLAMVYGIVKDHGGYILAENRPEGGAEFNIYLPVSEKLVQAQATATKRGARTFGRILCIDDEVAILEFMKEVLEAGGYQVHVQSDPGLAIQYFDEEHRDIGLVITDMMMPTMTGLSVIEHVKDVEPAMKVLGITAYSQFFENADPLQVAMLLRKPFTSRALLEAVEDAFATSNAEP